MEIDIEELELLESTSYLYEDSEDIEPPEPYADVDDVEEPQPPPEPQTNGHKRSRSEHSDVSNVSGNVGKTEVKRIRDEDWRPQNDEDWLRYSPLKEVNPVVTEQVRPKEEKVLSRYASEIDGDCVPVTAPDGERVYAKICRFEGEKKLDVKEKCVGLIAEPIDMLLQKLEQEAFTKALISSAEVESDVVLPKEAVIHEQLWVDKYSPKSFTDLLSDEHTNREVLVWLKQWDSCVFGSEIRSTSDEVLSALKRHSSTSQHKKPWHSNFLKHREPRWSGGRSTFPRDMNESGNLMAIPDMLNKKKRLMGPPEQKILLLCGPPGTGKTTLAHVAAKHCQYDVLEINASDDRSTSAVEAKILGVIEQSAKPGSKHKCLVVDEIDGALADGKGAVEVILKMVSSGKKSDVMKDTLSSEQQHERKTQKNRHKNASLSRPVICICNDLYAPSLRQLRQIAKVHMFVQPTVGRVVSRLSYICNKEGMRTDVIALTALAEYTECDIRSCLNTLQFLNKKQEALNVFDLGSQVIGQKDVSRSLVDIWKEIFQRKNSRREGRSLKGRSSMSVEYDYLDSLMSSRGDFDLIMDGIHENVLQLHYHDPMMQKTVKCFDCLGASDLVYQYVMRTQQMFLKVYMPPVAINVHHLVAQVQKPSIEWPKSQQRYRTMLKEKVDSLKNWHYRISPNVSRHLSISVFVEDLISPILHILSPPGLKPAALRLLSEKEKIDLAQLVSTMVSYSISYKNTKSDSLSLSTKQETALDEAALSFDPPISGYISFKDYRSHHYVLSSSVKQWLLHEIEKQKILQLKAGRSEPGSVECSKDSLSLETKANGYGQCHKPDHASVVSKNTENSKNSITSKPEMPSNLSNLVCSGNDKGSLKSVYSGNIKKTSGSSSKFFERFKKVNVNGSQSTENDIPKEATMERDLRPLLFKFNEGFTNAVKRPVRIHEFLL